MNPPAILLSLRPRFANAILAGTKTVEVRRRPIRAPGGTLLLLYASAPTMSVLGTAELSKIDVHDPDVAWKEHEQDLGLTRDEFDAYLTGSDVAYLIHVRNPQPLNEPLPLRDLRASAVTFTPPQSFRYVTARDPAALWAVIPTPLDPSCPDRRVIDRPAQARHAAVTRRPDHDRPQNPDQY